MSDEKRKDVFHRILVPVTGTDADDDTLRAACWLAKRDKSRLFVMYVITMKRSLPLEAEVDSETHKAEEILSHMEKIAQEENYPVETNILQAREIAPTIVGEAADHKIDLIVMGVRPHTRFGQFSLGSIVPYVLCNAPCRVMLYSRNNNIKVDREKK